MHLAATSTHTVWNRDIPPVLRMTPGTELSVEVANSSGGQLSERSVAADVAAMDFTNVNPVTGPIFVEGAEPGDILVVDILDIAVDSWGWTANIPDFGLLSDDFPEAYLRISSVDHGTVELLPGLTFESYPMVGTIGVAAPEPGESSVLVPTRWGGNMDIRHIGPGSTLLLPVGVEGALLSLGDTHAAMGDGEVCGTGIETGSTVTLRVSIEKGRSLTFPMVETDARSVRLGGAVASTGIGSDLMQATKDATRGMIDEIVRRTGLAPIDAYLLASVAGDLKVSEVVDAPNWVVTMHVARDLLA